MYKVVCGGEPVSRSQISLHFSLVLFFFGFGGAEIESTSLMHVVALAGAASGVGSAWFVVGLSVTVTVAIWRISGAAAGGFLILFLLSKKGFRLTAGVLCLVVSGSYIYTAGEIDLAGDVQLEAVKIIHTFSDAVKDHDGRCTQAELLIGTGILGQGASLMQLLEPLCDFNFVHRVLELRKGIGLILCILAGLWMFLVPAFQTRSGIVLEVYGNLGDPEALVATHLLELGLGAPNLL